MGDADRIGAEDMIAYFTETGNVYHRRRDCKAFIPISRIREAADEREAQTMRGIKLRACARCAGRWRNRP